MKLDEFHLHEALDRAHVLLYAFSDFVCEHPYIKSDRELRRRAIDISDRLGYLYQAIGRRRVKPAKRKRA